jgi:hypothetical protein
MTRPTDPLFDQRIADWLEEDPSRAPGQVLDTVLAAFPSIPRRRASRVPWRFPTMFTPIRLATAALIGVLAVGGAFYLTRPGQPAVGGPSPAPTPQVPATSGGPVASGVPATSGPAGGGSGSAHYEITGPDAASGDAKFASSIHDETSGQFRQIARFQDGSVVVKIEFAPPGCVVDVPIPCGTVDISTATLSLHDGGSSCTWDYASLTATGGTGTVECTDAVNPAQPATPNRVRITFTYHDPSAG